MGFGSELRAPHGGLWVIALISKPVPNLLAVAIGAAITAALTIILMSLDAKKTLDARPRRRDRRGCRGLKHADGPAEPAKLFGDPPFTGVLEPAIIDHIVAPPTTSQIADKDCPVPSTETITRETTLCISLAARPSNIGTRFHNFLYDELGLDYLYKSFAPTDIAGAISGVRALGIRGCAVSMPFKELVIALVDVLDASAAAIHSVNTIVNTDGHLRAYNTDYVAVTKVLASHQVPTDSDFVVLGSGGMAKAVVAALRDSGFRSGHVIARDEHAGHTLADQYGFRSSTSIGDLRPSLIINATPIGMTGGPNADHLPFDPDVVTSADTVFDVVAFPATTPLITLADNLGKRTISGAEVIALQAAEQFVLYTGIRPTPDQLRRASEFSRV